MGSSLKTGSAWLSHSWILPRVVFYVTLLSQHVSACGKNKDKDKSDGDCWWELWYFWLIVVLFTSGAIIIIVVYCKQHAKYARINAMGRRINHQMVHPPAPPSYEEPGHEPPPYHLAVIDCEDPPPPLTPINSLSQNRDYSRTPAPIRAESVPPPYSPINQRERTSEFYSRSERFSLHRHNLNGQTQGGYIENLYTPSSNTLHHHQITTTAQVNRADFSQEDFEILSVLSEQPNTVQMPVLSSQYEHNNNNNNRHTRDIEQADLPRRATNRQEPDAPLSSPRRALYTSTLQERLAQISSDPMRTSGARTNTQTVVGRSYNMSGQTCCDPPGPGTSAPSTAQPSREPTSKGKRADSSMKNVDTSRSGQVIRSTNLSNNNGNNNLSPRNHSNIVSRPSQRQIGNARSQPNTRNNNANSIT